MISAVELAEHPFIAEAVSRGDLAIDFVVVEPESQGSDPPPEYDPGATTIPDFSVLPATGTALESDGSAFSTAITRGVVRANTMIESINRARKLFATVRDDLAFEVLSYLALSRIALYPDDKNAPLIVRAAQIIKSELGITAENEADITFGDIKDAAMGGRLSLLADVDYETQ